MADDIFKAPVVDQTPADAPAPVLADLVGEGKKYKDDAALAKALLHKDMTIAQREQELAGLRQELATRNRLEEIADRLSQERTEPLTPPVTNTDVQGLNTTGLTPEEIDKRIAAGVQRERTLAAQADNRQRVMSVLKEKLGDNYPEQLRQTLSKIGLSDTEANDLAARNPTAFFAMVGVDPASKPQAQQPVNDGLFAPPRSTVSTSFQPTANTKNWDHYEAMRRSPDAKVREKYWSVSVQNEIHKQALAQPDPEAFYKR